MVDTLRKTLDLFSARERIVVAGIFCAALVTALIETFSVASIMPFMAVVADPGIVERNALLAAFRGWVGTETPSGFLTVLGVLVLAVLVLSTAVSAFTTWATMRFVWRKHDDLCARLFERYVGQPYAWFLDRNTAHLSKNLLNEASVVARGVLVPVLDLVVKAVVSIFILAFLVYIDPFLAGVTGLVLGGGYVALWSGVRGRQKRIGREQVDVNTVRYRLAAEAFGGIKELKVLGREEAVADRFRDSSRRYSEITTSQEMVTRLPRYVMEVVAFGGILLVVVYLLASREGIGEVLPVLSAFAFGGYKLMPALQGVFAGLTTVRFHGASLDDLHADLFGEVGVLAESDRWGEPAARVRRVDDAPRGDGGEEREGRGEAGAGDLGRPPPAAAAPRGEPAREAPPRDGDPGHGAPEPRTLDRELRLDHMTFAYPGSDEPVLRDVDLSIRAGEMVGLVGATGSGKTTLVDVILGLLPAPPEAFRIDGEAMTPDRLEAWRKSVGYVPQEIFLSDESVARNVALGIPEDRIDRARVERAARIARIHEFVTALPRGYDTVVGERGVRLSGGQRQRIGIARALYDDPPVLVLDEGTSALDGATEAEVTEAIRSLEPPKTLVWIAHRLRTVQECHRIYVLDEGRIVARGTYAELMRSDERFRAMARAGAEE